MGCLFAAGCSTATDGIASGRIILWHDDDAATSAALESLAVRFMEINPQIRVSLVAVPEEDMLSRYANAAELSLGPDLFIGNSTWISGLADRGLIQPLQEPDLAPYLSTAVENVTVRVDENGIIREYVYGIPYAITPNALYYNADMTTTPPETLTDMLDQATLGMGTAMTTRFDRAFWGVAAFGGSPFGEQGQVTLDRGGFASWLNWLTTSQNAAGMFLNNDRATLMALFTSERAAYFVGTPDDLPALREAMGEDANIRVAPLPAGPNGAAGPLLHMDAFMFNSASAMPNTLAALELASFLTNDANSLRLAREIHHVPANLRVPGINAQTYPIVNGFMAQARSAVAIQNTPAMAAIIDDGERLYRQVLDGVVDPALAASEFTATINTRLELGDSETTVARCRESGNLRLWHHWQGDDEAILEAIIDDFEAFCPNATVTSTQFSTETGLSTSYSALYESNIKPDVILVSDRLVFELASDEQIQPVQGDAIQQFEPQALNALTYQNSIFGTPVTLELTMLYYKRDQVTDLPRTLDDLIAEAAAGRTVALSTEFDQAQWGITTFGGDLFTPEMTLNINQNDAVVAWLDWLLEVSAMPGFVIGDVPAIQAFEADEATYYIGSTDNLSSFVDVLGDDTVALAELPAGEVGRASPLLSTDALMLNITLEEARLPLAQTFIDFATNSDNQARLFTEAQLIPANINFEVDANSALTPIRSQVTQSTALPNTLESETLLVEGEDVYEAVLQDGVAPTEAVMAFVTRFNEIFATPTPSAPANAAAE